jgi:two-component system, response regulator YesN
MYSVLIVDDEFVIYEGISMLIDWKFYGFEVCDYASNGLVALEKTKTTKYDVVITDIRMPEIDGLELIGRLIQSGYPAQYIILSGYRDFEYARSAIEFGVKNYILKPIDEDLLIQALKKIRFEIEEKSRLHLDVNENLSTIREKVIRDLVKMGGSNGSAYDKVINLGIPLKDKSFTIAILKLEHNEKGEQSSAREIDIIDYYSIKEKVSSYADKHNSYVFEIDEDKIGILFITNNPGESDLKPVMEELFNEIVERFEIGVTIAIGDEKATYQEVPEAYRNACKALQLVFFKGRNTVISYDEISAPQFSNPVEKWYLEDLQNSVKRCNTEDIILCINRLFERIKQNNLPIRTIQNLFINASIRIIELVNDIGADVDEAIGNKLYNRNIQDMQTIDALKKMLEEICISVSKSLNTFQKNSTGNIIDEITQYIKIHYREELHLNMIAKKYHMNPAYLGRLFKSTAGIGFNDYVNDCKIEYAARMLENNNDKVFSICREVGYADISYFYDLFKNKKGVTPSEYRKLHENGEVI